MSQVNVTINGRQFRMACEDGQEDRVTDLARDLDARIEGLRAKFGEIGDTRLTVMAALTVADELAEMGLRVKRLEQELAALQDARVSAARSQQDRTGGRRRGARLRRRAGRKRHPKTQPDHRRQRRARLTSRSRLRERRGGTQRHAHPAPDGETDPYDPRGCPPR